MPWAKSKGINISHFFIKELFLERYPNIASQHFGRAIGRTSLLAAGRVLASIPNAVGKGNAYPSNNKKFAYPAFSSYFGQQLYQNVIWSSELSGNVKIHQTAG